MSMLELRRVSKVYLRRQKPPLCARSVVREEAEIEATLAAHREWDAAGRPGTVSHDDAMAELLSGQ
jgi:hypothetical protein